MPDESELVAMRAAESDSQPVWRQDRPTAREEHVSTCHPDFA